MIVQDYALSMDATRDYSSYVEKEESLVAWRGGAEAREAAYREPVKVSLSPNSLERIRAGEASNLAVELNLSPSALKRMGSAAASPKIDDSDEAEDAPATVDELKVELLERLFFLITGKKVELQVFTGEEIQNAITKAHTEATEILERSRATNEQGEELVGWGVDYQYHEVNIENETTRFNAEGVVKTADGRQINLDLSLTMSRQFIDETHISVKAGDALIDPLVVNYAGPAADLADAKMKFDLDSDGKEDSISVLAPGSGYLALDENGNDVIDDGGELFGPRTGRGFSELADHDDDGNGWIDENDSVFDRLRIWNRDENGNDTLFTLAQVGIGAIHLGTADTQFDLTGDTGDLNGRLRETSVFLKENGEAGTIQEIDLVV